jgi:hypothetical protein
MKRYKHSPKWNLMSKNKMAFNQWLVTLTHDISPCRTFLSVMDFKQLNADLRVANFQEDKSKELQ